MTESLADAPPPQPAPDDALAPYRDTLFHIGLIQAKIDKLIKAQVDAEEQVLHRAGRDYAAGRLTIESLQALYKRYRDLVWREASPGRREYYSRAPFSWLWNQNVPVRSDQLPHFVKRADTARRHEPNGPHGSWEGEYPIGYAPRPPDGQSVVYVLFDHANVPCYVGSTKNFKYRIKTHARDKKFARWAAYPCEDRESAFELEERLLAEHKPYLNKRVGR
jgi:hypothetical protein